MNGVIKTILEQIKDNFEYPIGIKDKDKFSWIEGYCGEDGCTYVAMLPNSSTIKLDVTRELAESLATGWRSPRIREQQPIEVYIKEYETEIQGYESELKDVEELLVIISSQNSQTAKDIKLTIENKKYDLEVDIEMTKDRLNELLNKKDKQNG